MMFLLRVGRSFSSFEEKECAERSLRLGRFGKPRFQAVGQNLRVLLVSKRAAPAGQRRPALRQLPEFAVPL